MSNRKVSTDALETLGEIIGPDEKRDAIHLAVMPVQAQHSLRPGQAITIQNGKAHVCTGPSLFIVDPFLKYGPLEGQWFWAIMRPREVTSLRHVWTHPSIPEEGIVQSKFTKEESDAWLRNFLTDTQYDVLMAKFGHNEKPEEIDWASVEIDSEYLSFYGIDAHGAIPDEFWDHLENVTGQKMANRPKYFSCSC